MQSKAMSYMKNNKKLHKSLKIAIIETIGLYYKFTKFPKSISTNSLRKRTVLVSLCDLPRFVIHSKFVIQTCQSL